MRILYAHSFYRIAGGEDRHVRDQVELVSRAHDVELIAASNADLPDTATTAMRMVYSRGKKHEILATIDRFAPEVVHVHNAYPSLGSAVVLAAYERRVPVVMTVHNMRLRCPNGLMFTEGMTCHRCERGAYAHAVAHQCFTSKKQAAAYAGALWWHRFPMRLERRISRFIAPSDFMRQRLADWGFGAERVRMIRHFTRNVDTRPELPALGRHGLFVGRLSLEKGLGTLLSALQRAGDPPFIIIGDGPNRAELERSARQLNLSNTEFVGWRRPGTFTDLLSMARYVALPSICEENAPLVALEALAVGRPLLVSELGGLPELVSAGSGIIAKHGDVDDLAAKIRVLMMDDDLCSRASESALAFASEAIRPEAHLAHLQGLYRELTRGEHT